MRRMQSVKIVATLGPASSTYEMIRALHEAGADVFRLNMSHGSHAEIAERHAIIRQVEKDLDSTIGILADLQGPKLRVGVFANGEEELIEGASFRQIWPRRRVRQPVSRFRTQRFLRHWNRERIFWSTMAKFVSRSRPAAPILPIAP